MTFDLVKISINKGNYLIVLNKLRDPVTCIPVFICYFITAQGESGCALLNFIGSQRLTVNYMLILNIYNVLG